LTFFFFFLWCQPGLLFQYEPELDAFLEFLIWRFSIWVDKPTPGNALMNLRYRDERAAPIAGKEGILPYDFLSTVVSFMYYMFLEPLFMVAVLFRVVNEFELFSSVYRLPATCKCILICALALHQNTLIYLLRLSHV
jgi:hypothetical protein